MKSKIAADPYAKTTAYQPPEESLPFAFAPPPQRHKRSRRGLVLGVAAAATVFLVGAAMLASLAAMVMLMSGGAAKRAPLPTREEFIRQVLECRTREGVIAAFGRPDATDKTTDGGEWWNYYRGMSHDPVSDRDDRAVTLYFDRAGNVSNAHEVQFMP